jgi:hypothetical protein
MGYIDINHMTAYYFPSRYWTAARNRKLLTFPETLKCLSCGDVIGHAENGNFGICGVCRGACETSRWDVMCDSNRDSADFDDDDDRDDYDDDNDDYHDDDED